MKTPNMNEVLSPGRGSDSKNKTVCSAPIIPLSCYFAYAMQQVYPMQQVEARRTKSQKSRAAAPGAASTVNATREKRRGGEYEGADNVDSDSSSLLFFAFFPLQTTAK
eukprot:TRINITY_DN19069_c0_g1_i1.p1 TRINITY_DN19069_c0_g1~~TRINITY_DN19069_c0_g1_i1.p1  ORF type:complete len:108 (+),score=19.85 TRINITY_DN19069_c0_g1_i1:57-380(+)